MKYGIWCTGRWMSPGWLKEAEDKIALFKSKKEAQEWISTSTPHKANYTTKNCYIKKRKKTAV